MTAIADLGIRIADFRNGELWECGFGNAEMKVTGCKAQGLKSIPSEFQP